MNDKKYELLRYNNNDNMSDILSALNLVKKFIIKKKRILIGGMAMDFALKKKGKRIYSDEDVPDYDFLSPDHHTDAYDIAKMLIKEGYENVQVVGALHLTTMRVRVQFEWVADVGYAPPVIYDNIKTLDYDNLRIVHPYYSIMDQASSLCRPFDNVGREVVFQRWKKDNERMKLLWDTYPIKDVTNEPDYVNIVDLPTSGIILGWPALSIYLGEKIRKDDRYYVITNKLPEKILAYYNPIMGAPPTIETEDVVYFYTKDVQYIYRKYKNKKIASPSLLMWFFLYRYMNYGDKLAQEGLYKLTQLKLSINLDNVYNDETKTDTDKYNLDKFYKRHKPDDKPQNQYHGISDNVYKWDPANSRLFQNNGCEVSKKKFIEYHQ